MTLTLANGPLATDAPDTVNFRVEGPKHRLLFERFPRRVRAVLEGATVLDSRRGMLLHETALLPQLYVPQEDAREQALEPSEHQTHCPFKGDASYRSVVVGERRAESAVWAYESPLEGARWLQGYLGFEFGRMDAWFDEDEEIQGHLRDPYHRVDVRDSSRRVSVSAGGEPIAETDRPRLLSETGLANRYYVHPDDVRRELLEPSATHTVCPYKGSASYHSLRLPGGPIEDAAWFYPSPLEEARKISGYLCFAAAGIETRVDGKPLD